MYMCHTVLLIQVEQTVSIPKHFLSYDTENIEKKVKNKLTTCYNPLSAGLSDCSNLVLFGAN